MTTYIQMLQAEIAAQEAAISTEKADAANTALERLTPLEDRLARLLATIPADVQREGLSLPALRAGLKGRWRGTCHSGELGAALRKLGFHRRRQWRSEGGFKALWYPL